VKCTNFEVPYYPERTDAWYKAMSCLLLFVTKRRAKREQVGQVAYCGKREEQTWQIRKRQLDGLDMLLLEHSGKQEHGDVRGRFSSVRLIESSADRMSTTSS